jgi:exopolyphosphatase / guanosine-5'-triphosphate,3'-diphosphate pyrophosphatase
VRTKKTTIRLGEPVARTGRLGPEAFARALATIADLLDVADEEGADRVVVVATEALRVAADGPALRDRVLEDHGLPVQLLSGLDEARLSLKGMTAALNLPAGEQVLGLDLGGGSLEIALGGVEGLDAAVSLPLGGAKLVDRVGDPPRLHEQAALHRHCMDLLVPAAEELRPHRRDPDAWPTAIGTAGTIRDVGRLGLTLAGGASPAKVRGLMVSREQMELAYATICSVDVHERMDLDGVSPKRVDLLPAAGVPILAAMEAFSLPSITLCDWGLREGVLLDVVGRKEVVVDASVVDRR